MAAHRRHGQALALVAGCLLGACGAGQAGRPDDARETGAAAAPALANPAEARCTAAGLRVDKVLRNGVPVDAACVDPRTGARCPVWAWFRGECRLEGDTPPD